MLAEKVDTVVWSRSDDVALEIDASHSNTAYLGQRHLTSSLCATTDMSLALEAATLVVVAIPSHGLRSTLLASRALPAAGVPVVSLSKGLEEHTNQRMTEVLGDVWPEHPIAVLTGPNLAEEVFDGSRPRRW